MLIADTSVIVASINRKERHHAACRALIERLDEPVVVPASTLGEVDHLIHRQLGPAAMPEFLRRAGRGDLLPA